MENGTGSDSCEKKGQEGPWNHCLAGPISLVAQSGAKSKVGVIGHVAATSFFPSKNLGCYGDGGAIFTNDDKLAHIIRGIVNHGMYERYHHDVVGGKLAKKRLTALRFDNDTIKAVSKLIELHLRFFGYSDQPWSDSAVRRYVRDADQQLLRLHALTRADVTTRNQRKADRLSHAYDDLEQRIAVLQEQEELNSMRPELDGAQIMEILNLKPGREVGEAYSFLLEIRLDEGEIGQEEAKKRLLTWWQQR